MATSTKTVLVDGVEVFYREAGSEQAPIILLLHGFPSSSHQYRNLIPKLSEHYRLVAPDLPGFGFTKVPNGYQYTFDNIAKTIQAFTETLKLERFAIYIFDYGAPTGLRLALAKPKAITAIITQNGNAFEEGFGEFWNVLRKYWADPSAANRQSIAFLTTFEATKSQYFSGEAHPEAIAPEAYYLDQALLDRPGNADIQLDLFLDYRTNVTLYPAFQNYLNEHKPPVLAIWGKNDGIFIPPGAEAYKKLLPKTVLHFIDGGHFALENHLEEISEQMLKFLKANGI
ncbi:Alpha/Beta hydrolase protein [Mycena floridula]|nr:Alpha/Beta hydrolase protein [Mycena floridula]